MNNYTYFFSTNFITFYYTLSVVLIIYLQYIGRYLENYHHSVKNSKVHLWVIATVIIYL